jgi:hypothetical protein
LSVFFTQTLAFRSRHFEFSLQKSKKPLVLTVNGKAEIIVQDAEAYQIMLDRTERAETVEAIRKGIESFVRGEGRPAREALEELRQKHGISR